MPGSVQGDGQHSSGAALYRVSQAFAAIHSENGRLLTVKKGSLLSLAGPLKQFGLIEVVCAEQKLLIFARDIENCAQRVIRDGRNNLASR